MARLALLLAVAVPLTAAAQGRPARAVLTDAAGRKVGVATLHDTADGMCVALRLDRAAPGKKELRVEPGATCAPARQARSARPAADPAPAPADPARLAVVDVAADGTARTRLVTAGLSLDGAGALRGGALVLRDAAGARAACGRISGATDTAVAVAH